MFGEIKNVQGEILDYSYHPGAVGVRTIVVLGHGVTGNKDRPFVIALAEGLAAAGVPTLRFSFAGNGASEGRFEDSHISKEVEDLGTVLDVLDDYRVCYIGHSMGGAVGVVRTGQDERIRLLVSLAGMVHTKKFATTEFGMETPGAGFMWEDEECPLSQAYMDDLSQIDTVVDKAAIIHVPWLLVHGSEDDVVPVGESKELKAMANEPVELYVIEGANHVFSDAHTAPMVDKVVEWVKEHLA